MADVITMPKLGFDMAEGKLVHWLKAVGDQVAKGEIIADIETDKATVEVESIFTGTVVQHLVSEGEIVPVGTPIAVIAAPGEELGKVTVPLEPADKAGQGEQVVVKESLQGTPAVEIPSPSAELGERIKVSPLARRMAAEHALDLRRIKGSGTGGRIVRRDIEKTLTEALAEPPVIEPAVSAAPAPAVEKAVLVPYEVPSDQRVPLDRLRAIIGKRMVEAKQQIPHFYITHNYDVEAMLRLRQEVNSLLPEEAKISVNDFIVKAAALALRQYPNLNASIVGNEIIRHGHIHIGVAVGLEGGLITVVCRDADQKPLRLISSEIREMVNRARLGKLRPADIEGSTFSISNLGMYDVEHFVAIINPPEAAILAVGSAQKVPVVAGDEVKIASRMKATISADHRVTDGVEAAEFLKTLAKYLENPLSLLF